jgi:hypothetical protein
MLRRCSITTLLALFSVLLFAGCSGEGKKADPYAEVTLEQATRGPAVISKGFKYKLRNPDIVEMSGDILLVREDSIIEMIAGRSIADKLQGKDLSNIEFNVVKEYSPYVHFRCEEIVSGQDTTFISRAGAIAYPSVVPADGFKSKEHDQYDLDRLRWNSSADLNRAVDKQFWVTGDLALVEEDGDEVWMLSGNRGSTVRIVDPTDGIVVVLRLLLENQQPFEGGITFTEVEPWPTRRNNHVCGDVEVNYVKYMDKVVGSG